jgi:thioredoxin reductase
LKKQGIKNILVVDREPEAGGMPRFCAHIGFGIVDLWRLYTGPRYARYYRELAEKHGVEVRTSTTITGWNSLTPSLSQQERTIKLAFTSPSGLGEIEAKAVLLATGIRERPRAARMIPGTRPQGVYTTGSLQRFVHQERLPVGNRAVIVGAELVSLSALLTLIHAGVKCVGMTTEEAAHQVEFPYVMMKWGLMDILRFAPLIANARVTNIFGHKRVEGIEITRANNETEVIECDSVIFTGNWISENEMARLGGLKIDPVTKAPKIDAGFRSSVGGVFVAGNLLRGGKSVYTADQCVLEGMQACRIVAGEPALLVVDDALELRQPVRDRDDLVDLLLVLDDGDLHLGVLEHVGHLVGDRVLVDGDRNAAQALHRCEACIEARTVVADDGDRIPALQPELPQADGEIAHLRKELRPRPGLPDAEVLVPHGRARAIGVGIAQQQRGQGVELRACCLGSHVMRCLPGLVRNRRRDGCSPVALG